MKVITASIVFGPLMLIEAPPAGAGGPISSAPIFRLASATDSSSDRDSYTRKAQDEMREWQKKLQDFSASAQAKGQKAGEAAEKELNEAWTKTEAASRDLQMAGGEGWDSAKTSYEKASHDLAEAWHKVNPEDK
jgi:hypothetical protein